jgi:hypothetical protein
MSVEERLSVVETEQKTSIRILREIRDDVKELSKKKHEQDIKIASLEQSRAVARKGAYVLGVPILGTVLHTILKTIGLY